MLRVLAPPSCRVAMVAPWDEEPARRFVAYRCRSGFVRLLGHAVIDEFATLSSPVFLGPRAMAGRLYDAGISLAHRRDPEMAIDLGWPPLVVGLPLPEPEPEAEEGWEATILEAVQAPSRAGEPLAAADAFARRAVGPHRLERAVVGDAVLWATDAPLLPKQLGRLCEVSSSPFALALATPALERLPAGGARVLKALSESRLEELLTVAREVEP